MKPRPKTKQTIRRPSVGKKKQERDPVMRRLLQTARALRALREAAYRFVDADRAFKAALESCRAQEQAKKERADMKK